MTNSERLPPDFINLLKQVLNEEEAIRLTTSLNQKGPLSIRINPKKNLTDLHSSYVPWCSTGYYLDSRPSFTLDPLFHAGTYYVQEASSMFLEQFINVAIGREQPVKALDLCAAPGGKSTHLLSILNSSSLLVSNEVIRSRASILSENIQKWGNANVIITQNDPIDFKELKGFFNLIVVDAPCSGEGLFRKDPEAMNEWSLGNVELCSQRQKRILADIFPALAKNGILIYSTCTFNHIENEDNLKWLAHQHDVDFIRIPNAKSFGVEEVEENGILGYRFFPHRLAGEGFFIAGIIKKETENISNFKGKKPARSNPEIPTHLKNWLTNPSDLENIGGNEKAKLFTRKWTEVLKTLSEHLNCIQIGTQAGETMHGKFIPDHPLSLSIELNYSQVPTLELTKEEAIRYLRKEPIHIEGTPSGYRLATYAGVALGWVNCLGNRSNNLYPTNWRIRMK